MATEMRRATARVKGGYRLVTVQQLCAVWGAYRQNLIEFRDLRVWFAAHEVVSRRCQIGRGRVPSHTLAELLGLVGGIGGEHLRSSLNRLERHRLIRWSASSICFAPATPETPFADQMLGRIINVKRRVPVPRRTIRFLAKCSRPTLVATVLGYLLRCVYARRVEISVEGCCSASWIAQTFDVDLRNVRRAKATLRSLGWLTTGTSPHWHRQRWGGRARVNADWRDLSQSRLPSPRSKSTTTLPPPLNKELSSKEILNPKPANRTAGASTKRVGKGNLKHVTLPDLHDSARLDALWRQAAALGWVTPTASDRLNVYAAAERAKRIGRQNPCGLFIALVRGRLWSMIGQEDEDRARRSIRDWDESSRRHPHAETPRREKFLAPLDTEPVREVLLRSLASVSHLHGDDFPLRQTTPGRPMAGGSLSGANRGRGGTVGEEAPRTRGVAP